MREGRKGSELNPKQVEKPRSKLNREVINNKPSKKLFLPPKISIINRYQFFKVNSSKLSINK